MYDNISLENYVYCVEILFLSEYIYLDIVLLILNVVCVKLLIISNGKSLAFRRFRDFISKFVLCESRKFVEKNIGVGVHFEYFA